MDEFTIWFSWPAPSGSHHMFYLFLKLSFITRWTWLAKLLYSLNRKRTKLWWSGVNLQHYLCLVGWVGTVHNRRFRTEVPEPGAWAPPGTFVALGLFRLPDNFVLDLQLSLGEILQPATELALSGFPVAEVTAHHWANWTKVSGTDLSPDFLINGRPPRHGEVFRNPALAQTFKVKTLVNKPSVLL